jgi:hypothetical protein
LAGLIVEGDPLRGRTTRSNLTSNLLHIHRHSRLSLPWLSLHYLPLYGKLPHVGLHSRLSGGRLIDPA